MNSTRRTLLPFYGKTAIYEEKGENAENREKLNMVKKGKTAGTVENVSRSTELKTF